MLKRYIVILVVIILVVIFAVQNVDQVSVTLWMFNFNASLSLIIVLTLAIGALLSLLFTYRELQSRNKTIKKLKDQLKSSESKSPGNGYTAEKQASRAF